jgi:putative transposase
MERKFQFAVDEFYHVYSRGNNKSKIFLIDSDKKRFLKLLFLCNNKNSIVFKDVENLPLSEIKRGETLVDIGAYCLMPNHIHLLLHEKEEKGISMFMAKLLTAYSMYFNKRHKRTGALFEGRFLAKYADKDDYLQYLFSYIHLNPVKIIVPNWKTDGILDIEKTKQYLSEYFYSSYCDYMGKEREENLILNKVAFPEYFENFTEFEQFIDVWLMYNEVETTKNL